MDSSMASHDSTSALRTHAQDDDNQSSSQWRDLPNDLLTKVASELGIISLLRFRSVCRDWNSAANSLTAEIESSPGKRPWLLSYLENSDESVLLDGSGKYYRLKTPQLNGANCIASRDGWILVQKKDSVFFFCPFSHAKIDLPKLPTAVFPHCSGAFTAAPTSNGCVVSVIFHNEAPELTLYFLGRGEKAWSCEKLRQSLCREIALAACFEGKFAFLDNAGHCVMRSPGKMEWSGYSYSEVRKGNSPSAKAIRCRMRSGLLYGKRAEMVKEGLELCGEDDVSAEICGTVFPERDGIMTFVLGIKSGDKSKCNGILKGVWIQPRLFSVASDFAW